MFGSALVSTIQPLLGAHLQRLFGDAVELGSDCVADISYPVYRVGILPHQCRNSIQPLTAILNMHVWLRYVRMQGG